MDKEVTDFPEPDSPTNATVSPLDTVKEIFFTASVMPLSEWKLTCRFFICNNGVKRFTIYAEQRTVS